MAKKNTGGRPRIGQPISITVTDDMRAWIDDQIRGGGSRCEVIRRILNAVWDLEQLGQPIDSVLAQVAAQPRKRKAG